MNITVISFTWFRSISAELPTMVKNIIVLKTNLVKFLKTDSLLLLKDPSVQVINFHRKIFAPSI